ncbi:MAG: putative ATP-dependent helicase, partial [Pseudomonadota bacterium]
IDQHGMLVVEAGTGVGKTYAYLVPALLSGKKVLISTATKALQDQLCQRDLPALLDKLVLPKQVRLLKGRGNYLCQLRLSQVWQRIPQSDRFFADQANAVTHWAQATQTGDLDELFAMDETGPLRPWVTSTAENCTGNACQHIGTCHFYAARRQALAADIVVVNHHLFFADFALKATADVQLLPSAEVVVMDEAHHLLDIGAQFLGHSTGTRVWWDWLQEVVSGVRAHAFDTQNGLKLAAALESALVQIEGVFQDLPTKRLPWPPLLLQAAPAQWLAGQNALLAATSQLIQALGQAGSNPELQALGMRGQAQQERWLLCTDWSVNQDLQGECATVASWVEPGAHPRWTRAPLTLQELGALGQVKHPANANAEAPLGKTWVFTSATLAIGDRFDRFTEPLGLGSAKTLQVPSPFDYGYQASVYVPPELPDPGSSDHATELAGRIWPWVLALGGRTLVLTTTLRSLDAVGNVLKLRAAQDLGPEVLSQGKGMSKRELLDRFRRAGQPGGAGAVLVASYSFWEGVDLSGDCLQMVVIDKLPFPPPDDPWVQAQAQLAESKGQNAFKSFHLPEAALALKQGAGRLIRSETDHGLLVIGDNRLTRRGYGKTLMRSLPPMRMLKSEAEVQLVLSDLVTRASTKDLPWT